MSYYYDESKTACLSNKKLFTTRYKAGTKMVALFKGVSGKKGIEKVDQDFILVSLRLRTIGWISTVEYSYSRMIINAKFLSV
jgi:hypothetical protein